MRIWPLALWCLLVPVAHAEPTGSARRMLSGEEILTSFRVDQWHVAAESRDGFRSNARILPDGRIAGTNLSGGGALEGQWGVYPSEDVVCLYWAARMGLAAGCYLLVKTGVVSYELVDPGGGAAVWQFVILNH